jgi:hypothetical protein
VYDTAKAAIIVKKLSKKYKTSLPEVFLEEGRDVRAVLASYDEGTTAYDVYTQEIYDRYHDIVSIWLDIKYHIDAADVSSIAGILEYMQCEYADVLPHIFAPVRKEILSSLQEYLGKVKSIRKYFEHISEKNISRSVAKMMGVSQEVFIGDIDIVSDE